MCTQSSNIVALLLHDEDSKWDHEFSTSWLGARGNIVILDKRLPGDTHCVKPLSVRVSASMLLHYTNMSQDVHSHQQLYVQHRNHSHMHVHYAPRIDIITHTKYSEMAKKDIKFRDVLFATKCKQISI